VAGLIVLILVTAFGVEMTLCLILDLLAVLLEHFQLTLVTTEVARGIERNELQKEVAFEPTFFSSSTMIFTTRHSRDLPSRFLSSRTSIYVQKARLHRSKPTIHSKRWRCIMRFDYLKVEITNLDTMFKNLSSENGSRFWLYIIRRRSRAGSSDANWHGSVRLRQSSNCPRRCLWRRYVLYRLRKIDPLAFCGPLKCFEISPVEGTSQ